MNHDVFEALEKLPNNISIAYFDPTYGSNNEKCRFPVFVTHRITIFGRQYA
jgi:hypothetical protein